MGLDGSVGIATGYGLDGAGDFSQTSRPVPGSGPMGTESFPGIMRPGRGADYLPPSSAEVKKG
jgi:hypothetical protein